VLAERMVDEALVLAEELAAIPLDAAWAAKRLLHQNALEQDLRRVVTQGAYAIRELRGLAAHHEATLAFLEKRQPVFHPLSDA